MIECIESPGLAHLSYLVGDGGVAAVIDPRRDCEVYVQKATDAGQRIAFILETHRNEDYVVGMERSPCFRRMDKLNLEGAPLKARAFFGPGGLGMEVTEMADCCARFAGAGGQVYVQASPPRSRAEEEPGGSRVEIQGREWEHQIRQFLGQI